jgi:hypothetical protein
MGTVAKQAHEVFINECDGVYAGYCYIKFQLAEHFFPADFNYKLRMYSNCRES